MPGEDGVLVTASSSGRPAVEVVRVADWTAHPLPLQALDGRPARGEGRAVLLTHNFSVPDLERWVKRVTPGLLQGGKLAVDGGASPGPLELPPELRLWERIQRHRTLERRCRRGISAAERSGLT